ncbi:DUF3592 domain-containing protein [Cellulosimicrobium sp. PMB13]|uniref:DUF3592 domain-containing protein n=1 Tax=Cellulosimicrobium sp. PMB13 TaxID=3120158 RepID=UPI003F4C21F6
MHVRVRMIVGGVFAAVGLGLVVAAVVIGCSTYSFQQTAERTTGTVVDLDVRWGSHGSRSSSRAEYPVVEFEADGQRYTVVSAVTGTSHPEIGDDVTVLYDPADPSDARLDSGPLNHALEVILGGAGVVFAGFGSSLLVRGLRRRGAAAPPAAPPAWPSDAVV